MPDQDELILESLDVLPEPLRAFFKQDDAGYKFSPPEDPAPLKRKNAEIIGEKKRLQQQLEELRHQASQPPSKLKIDDEEVELDVVAEAWRKLKAAPAADSKGDAATLQAEWAREQKKKLDALETKHKAEVTTHTQRIAQLEEQLNVNVCEGGLLNYCNSAKLPFKLEDGAAETLLDIARARKPFVVKDGKWSVRDDLTDDDGNPVDTPEAWLAWQVAKRPYLVVRSTGGGAGSNGAGSTPGLSRKKLEDMSDAEKAQLNRDDPEAFRKAVMAAADRRTKQIQQQRMAAA